MNHLAKQLVDDDGVPVPVDEQCWHYVMAVTDDDALLCSGEYIVDASSGGKGAQYQTKLVKRGGITCSQCLKLIRQIKAIAL